MKSFSKHKLGYVLIALGIFLCSSKVMGQSQSINSRYPIIPYPARLIPKPGVFRINSKTSINVQDKAFDQDANDLKDLIKNISGITLLEKHSITANCIILRKDTSIRNKEGYALYITPQQIILSAPTSTGLFWGIETIRQLLPPPKSHLSSNAKELKIPAVEIEDHPAFAWRGMHIDVVRHFFSEAYLKKFIDRMAMYKLNRLHIHLTDDEGWRIQIKRYPQLTRKGAWRTFDKHDSACMRLSKETGNPDFDIDSSHIIHKDGKTLYGGYYTQKQMRSIISYAAARHIEIIPELDMPGHMMAAIKVFPYLSCTGKAGHGPVFSEPLCPCNKKTYEFAENVYKEIFALFPSKNVHIGGDEVDKTTWKNCSACKALMQKAGLKNVNQLQSYFIKRMEQFFHAHGKILVGWDDILEGGIDSSAVIMYWRSWHPQAPIKAAENGNKVIMAPGFPFYFNNFPNRHSLYNVYHFNPYPKGLSTRYRKKIIGVQACLWSELVPTEKRADYLTMPRMTALAEVAWTNNPKDYQSYLERLREQYHRWDLMHIHYRLPDLNGIVNNTVFVDSTILTVKKPLANLTVHYTTNGTIPTQQTSLLPKHLHIYQSETIKLAAFTPMGNRGEIYTLHFQKEAYIHPARVKVPLREGLTCSFYTGKFDSTKEMIHSSPAHALILDSIGIPSEIKASTFGLQFNGYIQILKTGIYDFSLNSDDGSVLYIDGKQVINNDGLHSAKERSGEIALQKGYHNFSLDYIQGGGGYKLQLKFNEKGNALKKVPESILWH